MKEARYHALTVANYIIRYSIKNNFSISNLKLQKILYFVQAQFLVAEDQPCFKEQIEAWTFGPVVPEVYYTYKFFGSSDINFVQTNLQENISSDDKKLIESMVKECAPYSTSQLVRITYRQLPWKEAFVEYQSNPISAASIKKFFFRMFKLKPFGAFLSSKLSNPFCNFPLRKRLSAAFHELIWKF